MICAEIGQNFQGSMSLAQILMYSAKTHGADMVKFQLYDHKKLYGKEYKDVSLSFAQADRLFEYGERIGIEVFFSVFDVERVKWCETIGVKRYKISCEMRDNDVLDAVEKTGKPIIFSSATGDRCIKGDMLYCIPKYPAEINDLKDMWKIAVAYNGYSDHTIGLDACKIALARGANIIEKHFCLDHSTGVDAMWSMDANELKELKRWHDECRRLLCVE